VSLALALLVLQHAAEPVHRLVEVAAKPPRRSSTAGAL
jgi:hypothetical protein